MIRPIGICGFLGGYTIIILCHLVSIVLVVAQNLLYVFACASVNFEGKGTNYF